MRNEFAAVIEQDGDWYGAYCPEIPGANGQGKTREECRHSLGQAISLILENRREELQHRDRGTLQAFRDALDGRRG